MRGVYINILICLFVFLFYSPVVLCTAYSLESLNKVTEKFVKELDKNLRQDITDVVVYLFVPAGKVSEKLSQEELLFSRQVNLSVERALINIVGKGHIKNVITRDFEKWKKILDTEYEHGILNPDDVPDVGHGIGAKFVITGEYFFDKNGKLHIQGKVFDPLTGVILATSDASDSFLCLYEDEVKTVLFVTIVSVITGLVGFLIFKSIARKSVIKLEKALTEAIESRNIERVLFLMKNFWFSKISSSVKDMAYSLVKKVRGLQLTNPKEGVVRFAPGPVQGIGRGKDWVFEVFDPHFSRSPQAWIRYEDSKVTLEHNKDATNPTRVNENEIEKIELNNQDVITAGSSAGFLVSMPSEGSWVEIRGEDKLESRLVFVKESAPLEENSGCVIKFKDGIPYLQVMEGTAKVTSTIFQKTWILNKGEEIPLMDEDFINEKWRVSRLE